MTNLKRHGINIIQIILVFLGLPALMQISHDASIWNEIFSTYKLNNIFQVLTQYFEFADTQPTIQSLNIFYQIFCQKVVLEIYMNMEEDPTQNLFLNNGLIVVYMQGVIGLMLSLSIKIQHAVEMHFQENPSDEEAYQDDRTNIFCLPILSILVTTIISSFLFNNINADVKFYLSFLVILFIINVIFSMVDKSNNSSFFSNAFSEWVNMIFLSIMADFLLFFIISVYYFNDSVLSVLLCIIFIINIIIFNYLEKYIKQFYEWCLKAIWNITFGLLGWTFDN